MKRWIIEPDNGCVTTLLKERIARMGEKAARSSPSVSDGRLRSERRLYPRMPCFLLVDFAIQGCAYRAFIRDISADGAFIESHEPVPPGPEIFLVISFLDDRRPVKVGGKILRTGGQGIGVRFDPVADTLT